MSKVKISTQKALDINKSLYKGNVEELFILIGEYLNNNNIVFSKAELKPIEKHCISILDK